MLHATLAAVLLASGICYAGSIITPASGNNGSACEYEVFYHSKWVKHPISPEEYGFFTSHAKTVEECTQLCYDHPQCVSAQFNPDNKKGPSCEAATQLGYSVQPIKPAGKKNVTVVQLIANSCDRPVATPTPVGCTPGTITDREGCVYKVTCGEQLDHLPFSNILLTKSALRCFETEVDRQKRGYGFTFYQGGDCRVNFNEPGFPKLLKAKTSPRAHTYTAQIVKGSCAKAM